MFDFLIKLRQFFPFILLTALMTSLVHNALIQLLFVVDQLLYLSRRVPFVLILLFQSLHDSMRERKHGPLPLRHDFLTDDLDNLALKLLINGDFSPYVVKTAHDEGGFDGRNAPTQRKVDQCLHVQMFFLRILLFNWAIQSVIA